MTEGEWLCKACDEETIEEVTTDTDPTTPGQWSASVERLPTAGLDSIIQIENDHARSPREQKTILEEHRIGRRAAIVDCEIRGGTRIYSNSVVDV